MKRISLCIVVFLFAQVFRVPVHAVAQTLAQEGMAWLATKTEPAQIKVDGSWRADDWGPMLLHQAENAREVTGTADNWEITGVVSGKQLFLVFSSKGDVAYTAQVALMEDGSLSGAYSKGLSGKSRDLVLRKSGTTGELSGNGPAGASTQSKLELAHVVVYRDHYHNCPQVKPKIYMDGKEVADIQNGRYFTFAMTPGKHLVGTQTIGKMGSQVTEVNADPGSTYYLHIDFPSAWVCTIGIEKVDAATAMTVIKKTKPADANRVKMPEIVSLDVIEK